MSESVHDTMKTLRRLVFPVVLGSVLLASPLVQYAQADGEDDGEPTCRKGLVWDKKKQMCIPAQSGVISDDALADYAFALAGEERFAEALDILALAENQNNAKILNYRGYANRKLGRIDEGIHYYHQALSIDPDNVLVRSYLGEAYLKKGDSEKARALLAEIRDRCGTECKPYINLANAIEASG